ncbi:hypothetical protein D3C86_1163860 [compost metagenome]
MCQCTVICLCRQYFNSPDRRHDGTGSAEYIYRYIACYIKSCIGNIRICRSKIICSRIYILRICNGRAVFLCRIYTLESSLCGVWGREIPVILESGLVGVYIDIVFLCICNRHSVLVIKSILRTQGTAGNGDHIIVNIQQRIGASNIHSVYLTGTSQRFAEIYRIMIITGVLRIIDK